ncbi:MAG: hypothetical protein P4L50_24660 [Anaerolineaceae bacterium]|nr:hypothetical protein [Anaerolineaceae bacterium]
MEKDVYLPIRIDSETNQKIELLAQSTGRTKSDIARHLIKTALGGNRNKSEWHPRTLSKSQEMNQ